MQLNKIVLLLFTLMLSLNGILPVKASETIFDRISFENTIDLGIPMRTDYILRVATTQQTGVPIACTVCGGSPASFNAVNLNTGEVLYSQQVEGDTYWMIETDIFGDVYFGNYNNPLTFYRYSPKKNIIENLGKIPGGGTALISLAAGEDGNLYLGTFPNGAVLKYDPVTATFTNYGKQIVNGQYVNSIAYQNNYVYFGEYGTELYKLNLTTKVREIMTPTSLGVTATNFSKLFIRGNYLVAMIVGTYNSKSQTVLAFYNLTSNTWEKKVIENIYGSYITKLNNGLFYYRNASNGYMYSVNMSTLTTTSIGKISGTGSYIRGDGFVTMEDQTNFPGLSFVNCQYNGNLYVVHFTTKKMIQYSNFLVGAPSVIRDMEFGPDNRLYISEYMGSKGAAWDLNTNTIENFALSQAEGMTAIGNQMVFGNYADAEIYVLDVTQSPLTSRNVGKLGQEQDRPFTLKEADGKAIIGSIPTYGKLGGALSIFDPDTESIEVYRNLIEEQSITGLTYQDGIIYGSSSVSCGLNITPSKTQAEVFKFDMATKTLLTSVVPSLTMISGAIGGIGDVAFGSDGLLWAYTPGEVFAMDPNTLEVQKELKLNEARISSYNQYWAPRNLIFDITGLLILSDNGYLKLVDPNTLEYQDTTIPATTNIILDENQDLYYFKETTVYKVPIKRNKKTFHVNTTGLGTVDKSIIEIYNGDEVTVKITPEDYNYIKTIRLNGIVVANDILGEYLYTVKIANDSILDIEFDKITFPPTIKGNPLVYTSPGDGGITFGTVITGNEEYQLKEYGIVFSKTEKIPELNQENCMAFKALVRKNAKGQFGIKLTGNGIKSGMTYFTRVYSIYEFQNESIILYGEPTAFTSLNHATVLFLNTNNLSGAGITTHIVD